VQNVGAPTFIKNTLQDLKEQVDSNSKLVGDFSTPISPTDRSSTPKQTNNKKKNNKEASK
jgi:hypothetical protein